MAPAAAPMQQPGSRRDGRRYIGAMRNRAPATAIVICLLALLGGCGGEDEGDPAEVVPAAGENTPPSGTPGVPAGAPYDVTGDGWFELSKGEQFAAAQAYIDDNPERCGDSPVAAVAIYVINSYGLDFPAYVHASEVLAEACAAAQQS